MKQREIELKDYINKEPVSIHCEETLVKAENLMMMKNCRHLPVTEKGKVIGVISDRDLKILNCMNNLPREEKKLKDILNPEFYTVEIDTNIADVVKKIYNERIDYALVMKNGNFIGIITHIDILQAFLDCIELLKKQTKN